MGDTSDLISHRRDRAPPLGLGDISTHGLAAPHGLEIRKVIAMHEGSNGSSDLTFSMVQSAFDTTKPTETLLQDFHEQVTSLRWFGKVNQIRELTVAQDEDGAKRVKCTLPAALPSGLFRERKNEGLIQHNAIVHVDLDKLGEQTEPWRDVIAADPHVLELFKSPSGTGLKVFFRCDPARSHEDSFRAAEQYVLEHWGLTADPACKNVARLCFVSHDPDALLNLDAKILPYPPPPVEVRAPIEPRGSFPLGYISPGDDFDARGDPLALLVQHGWTRHGEHNFTRPGKKHGISATWNTLSDHPNRLYVFSSNAAPFEPNHVYRPWHIFAMLECGGDFTLAASRLYDLEFGSRTKPKEVIPDENVQAQLDAANEETEIALERPYEPLPEELLEPSVAEKLISRCNARAFNFAVTLKEPIPRFIINKAHVCTPGNLSNLIGQSKTCKSTYFEAMIAAVIAADQGNTSDCDCLGLSASKPNGLHLIHFDTEQSIFDHDQLIRRAIKRSKATTFPTWLHSYCVTGFSILDCRLLIGLKLNEFHKLGGVYAVLVDGIGDCVVNVNDPDETNPFVTEIHEFCIAFDTCIISAIHENPGQDFGKGRGHLGSQLERKAESNLRLKKTDNIITVFSEKMRRGSILEKDGPRFSWDEASQMHLSTQSVASTKDDTKRDKLRDSFEGIVQHTGKDSFRFAELLKAISDVTGVGKSSAEDRFGQMKKLGVIVKDCAGFWRATP